MFGSGRHGRYGGRAAAFFGSTHRRRRPSGVCLRRLFRQLFRIAWKYFSMEASATLKWLLPSVIAEWRASSRFKATTPIVCFAPLLSTLDPTRAHVTPANGTRRIASAELEKGAKIRPPVDQFRGCNDLSTDYFENVLSRRPVFSYSCCSSLLSRSCLLTWRQEEDLMRLFDGVRKNTARSVLRGCTSGILRVRYILNTSPQQERLRRTYALRHHPARVIMHVLCLHFAVRSSYSF